MPWPPTFPEIRAAVPLSGKTTFRIGGPAAWFAEPESEEALRVLVREARDARLAVRVLGGGSNVLVDDAGVDGLVIRLGRMAPEHPGSPRDAGFHTVDVDAGRGRVCVGASVPLGRLLRVCGDAGLAGLELFAGIPGTVGGALAMNAGGGHPDAREGLADRAAWVDVMRFDGRVERLAPPAWRPVYRDGGVGQGVVLRAAFALAKDEPVHVRARTVERARIKEATQPVGWPSAGCVFRNPPEGSAGRIIDRAGLKGASVGDAAVSEKHANFIINKGAATARDVNALIDQVQRVVAEKSGVHLEREIHRWP